MGVIIGVLKCIECFLYFILGSGYPNEVTKIFNLDCMFVLIYSLIVNAIAFYYIYKLKLSEIKFKVLLSVLIIFILFLGYLAIVSLVYNYPINLRLTRVIGIALSGILIIYSYRKYKASY